MKIKPLSEYVWIVPDEEDKKSKVVVAGEIKKDPFTGIVYAVGQAVDEEIKPKKRVSYRRSAVDYVTIDGKEFIVCRQEEILAVLD